MGYMTDARTAIIDELYSNPEYTKICKKICTGYNHNYSDDLMQEVAEVILSIPVDRLPPFEKLRFWFYRTAANMMTKTGSIGKSFGNRFYDLKAVEFDFVVIKSGMEDEYLNHRYEADKRNKHNPKREIVSDTKINESYYEKKIKQAGKFMISLSEFENRLILLYNEHKNVAKISRLTGINIYTIHRSLDKIKQKAKAFA